MANVYKIYPTINFGVAKFNPGFIKFEEIYELAQRIRIDKDFSKIHYQYVDLRGCKFSFKPSVISKLFELINKYSRQDNQERGVYVVDSPLETAYVQIFFNELDDKRKLCSTVNKAHDLLKIPVSFSQFEKLIDI